MKFLSIWDFMAFRVWNSQPCHYSLWIWMIDIFAGYNENAKRNVCFGCHYHCICTCTWKPFEYLFHEVVKSGSVGAFIFEKKMPFFFAFVSLKCSHFLWSDGASFQSSHDSFIWTIITKVTISKNSANKKYKNKNSMNIEHRYRRTLTYAQTSKWNLGRTTDFSHHDSNIDSYVYSTIRKL